MDVRARNGDHGIFACAPDTGALKISVFRARVIDSGCNAALRLRLPRVRCIRVRYKFVPLMGIYIELFTFFLPQQVIFALAAI